MIRGQHHVAVAVRRSDGNIVHQCKRLNPIFTGNLKKIPLVRGVIVLIETMTLGMQALSYSANIGLKEEGQELSKGAMASMICFSLLFAIGLFFLVPVLASRSLEGQTGSDLSSNIVEGVLRLIIFVAYLIIIGKMQEIRRVFMYHGAEHMTVHAKENGDYLNVDSVRKYPTAHPRCGTAFLLVVLVMSILVFVFVGRDPLWWLITSRIVLLPFIAAASYELIRLSGRYSDNPLVRIITGPSLALQKLTTRNPEDDQIEIAITAMNLSVDADEGRIPIDKIQN